MEPPYARVELVDIEPSGPGLIRGHYACFQQADQ
jgi:hypothetical protein